MDRVQAISSLLRAYREKSLPLPELQERIQKISAEVMDGGSDIEKRLLVQVIVAINSVSPEAPLELGSNEVRTIKGSISQFTGETQSSACTSIAQRFLRQVLSLGRAQDFQGAQIDEIVRDGKSNFNLLLHNAQRRAKDLGMPLNQSFSHPDSAMIYGLDTVSGERGKVLVCKRDSTVEFFEDELRLLEGLFGEHGNVGGVIHAKGYTFAVAILNQGTHVEYVLFDSHGCSDLNGSKEAFVTITKSRTEMAKVLSVLCPYAKNDLPPETVELIPKESLVEMEREYNPYILYVVKLVDHGILGVAHRAESLEHKGPELTSSHVGSAPSSQGLSSAAMMRERKLRVFAYLFMMSMLATTYHYRKPLSHYVFSHTIPKDPPLIPPRVVPPVA